MSSGNEANKESDLESTFAGFFAGSKPGNSDRKSIDEDIVWRFLIQNLDGKRVSSADLDALIISDYYLGLIGKDDPEIYKIIKKGKRELVDYCLERIASSDLHPGAASAGKAPSQVDLGDVDLPLRMLYQFYTNTLKKEESIRLIKDSQSIEDLKAIVFLDSIASAKDGIVSGIISEKIPLRDRVIKAAEACNHDAKVQKAANRISSMREDAEKIAGESAGYNILILRQASEKVNAYTKELSGYSFAEVLESKEVLASLLVYAHNSIKEKINGYQSKMNHKINGMKGRAAKIIEDIEDSGKVSTSNILFKTGRYGNFVTGLDNLRAMRADLRASNNELKEAFGADERTNSNDLYVSDLDSRISGLELHLSMRTGVADSIARLPRDILYEFPKKCIKGGAETVADLSSIVLDLPYHAILRNMKRAAVATIAIACLAGLGYIGNSVVGYAINRHSTEKIKPGPISAETDTEKTATPQLPTTISKYPDEGKDNVQPAPNYPPVYIYVVNKDESLSLIAKKLTGNMSNYSLIAQHNNIENPNMIYISQFLVVPDSIVGNSDQLYHLGFVSGLRDSRSNALPREYYFAGRDERLDDIVYKVTGNRANTDAVFNYNYSMNPTFGKVMEGETHVHFPPELVRNREILRNY